LAEPAPAAAAKREERALAEQERAHQATADAAGTAVRDAHQHV